jgi:hypothetical protein
MILGNSGHLTALAGLLLAHLPPYAFRCLRVRNRQRLFQAANDLRREVHSEAVIGFVVDNHLVAGIRMAAQRLPTDTQQDGVEIRTFRFAAGLLIILFALDRPALSGPGGMLIESWR